MFERSFNVSLAQRYWNFEWDELANRAAYGSLASKSGVGANLRVRIFSNAERDLQPGQTLAKGLLDHRALFADEVTFARRPSTLEALTQWAASRLSAEFESIAGVEIVDEPNLACLVRARALERLDVKERVGNLTVVRGCDFDPSSGLGFARDGAVERAVRAIMPRFANAYEGPCEDWARDLSAALRGELAEVIDLRIDLGEREPLRAKRAIKETTHAI